MKKNVLLVIGATLLICGLFGIIEPYATQKQVESETLKVLADIENLQTPSNEPGMLSDFIPYEDAMDSIDAPTPTPTPIPSCRQKFNTNWLKSLGLSKNSSEKEYLDTDAIGLVEIPESGISVTLRYGTYYKSNIKYAAGLTEFSTDERIYILGHNYNDGTVFHNLIKTKVGEEVKITLISEEYGVLNEYTFEVVFSKRYTESEYEANNHEVFTKNPDYEGEYDMVLATCNHYSKSDEGRQVLLCRLVEE